MASFSLLWLLASTVLADDTWNVISTVLLQSVREGERQLIVHDCRKIVAGGRLRLAFAETEEEEGAVASVECPSPGLSRAGLLSSPSSSEQQQQQPCDVAKLATLTSSAVPEHCKELVEAALRVPGMAASYRSAQRAHDGALLPAALGDDVASSSTTSSSSSSADADATSGQPRVPGVVTLSAGVLFAHGANVTVRGTAPLSPEVLAEAACPTAHVHGVAAALACSGRGTCESAACVCNAGWAGAACETKLCAGGCGGHGTCVGSSCACIAGWRGVACEDAICDADCSHHGHCAPSHECVCDPGFHGSTCAQHTTAACEQSCNGHGNCAVSGASLPVCLCHSRYVGATCLEEINDCPMGCSGHGVCRGGKCACYEGWEGNACALGCPGNCTAQRMPSGATAFRGRCINRGRPADVPRQCICKEGFHGSACELACLNRCQGNGECVGGTCQCREGYGGADCGKRVAPSLDRVIVVGLSARNPLLMMTLLFLGGVGLFCCLGYVCNRMQGESGTRAVPMWDYYAKRWRNAPVFEPVHSVSAGTQTQLGRDKPLLPSGGGGGRKGR